MRELDQQLGDPHCDIIDREKDIMYHLQELALGVVDHLLRAAEVVAKLDCLLSLAVCAMDHNLVRPQLVAEPMLHIVRGRHLLQEMCVNTFVPNDTKLSVKCGKMLYLTGPNASGKSVYLKQVGLITIMAMIGSFVPAEAATIGLVDRVYSRIHTRESVSLKLSSFMIDLNQVSPEVIYMHRIDIPAHHGDHDLFEKSIWFR